MFPIMETFAIPHIKLREEEVTEDFTTEADYKWMNPQVRSSRSQLFLKESAT